MIQFGDHTSAGHRVSTTTTTVLNMVDGKITVAYAAGHVSQTVTAEDNKGKGATKTLDSHPVIRVTATGMLHASHSNVSTAGNEGTQNLAAPTIAIRIVIDRKTHKARLCCVQDE